MRLLKAKTENLILDEQKLSFALYEKIFNNLCEQFNIFLRDLSKIEEFRGTNPLEGVKAMRGEFLLNDEEPPIEKRPYFFLRIPGQPGLLLEPSDHTNYKLSLVLATEARPIQRQWSGEMTTQVIFVRKSNPPLAVFKIVEEDVIRNESNSKTLFGNQFFESLVEILILQASKSVTRI